MSPHRILLVSSLLAAAFSLTGCPDDKKPPVDGNDGGVDLSCNVDDDCPNTNLFRCDQGESTCVATCRTKADCSAEVRGEWALEECAGDRGCECDQDKDLGGVCAPALCSADSDCGATNVCRNGQCVAPPDVALATSCRISPDVIVTREGEAVRFFVTANTVDGSPIVSKTVTWNGRNSLSTVTQNDGHYATFTMSMVTNGSAPVEAVQAVIGGAQCSASAIILSGTVTAGSVRSVVVDELSGRPIEGARVIVSDASGAVSANGVTNASGVVTLTASGAVTVTAAHTNFTYVTYANVDVPAGGGDLYFALRRNPVDNYGGFKGTFSGVPENPNIQAGIAGMSFAGSAVDFSFSQLLGRTVPTNISIGGQNLNDVPLPAGVFLRFNNTAFKSDIEGQGLASTCTSALASGPESLIANGTCGTRTAWGFSADNVLFTELPIDALRNTSNPDIGAALSQSLPLLRKFRHSLARDVQFRLEPTPGAATGTHNFNNTGFFTNQNLVWQQMPLGFSFAIRVPPLPLFQNKRLDSVIALSSVNLPGLGLVPIGLGAAVNENDDDRTDPQDVMNTAGVMRMRMAPAHSGVETTEYGMTVVATSLNAATGDASVGLSTTGIYQRFDGNKLVFDGAGENPVAINGQFLPIPTGARFDFRVSNTACTGATLTAGLKICRQFNFSGTPGFTAEQVIRVTFTDRREHRWIVYLAGNQAGSGFRLPRIDAAWTLNDRTFHDGASSSRATMVVQALELKKGATAVPLSALAALNNTNADQLAELATRFSILDYAKPTVAFVSPDPKASNPSMPNTGRVTVQVRHFKVGGVGTGDGGVRLTFSGAASGACTAVQQLAENGVKSGEVELTLPGDCTGPDVDVTAALVDVNGLELEPAARATLAIDLVP